MARLLLFDNDYRTTKLIQEAMEDAPLKTVQDIDSEGEGEGEAEGENLTLGSKDDHEIFQCKNIDEFLKLINSKAFDFSIIEDDLIQLPSDDWFKKLKSKFTIKENINIPFYTMGHETDYKIVKKYLNEHSIDYITKPLDLPLFRQKLELILAKGGTMEKHLYTTQTDAPVDVAYQYNIKELSEYGLLLKSNKPFLVNEYVSFYADLFKDDEGINEVIGRCYRSDKDPNENDSYLSNFVFVGISPSTLKAIRSWLRQEYVRKKSA